METILDRIKQIADNEGFKITPFEKEIGASKGVFSRAIKNSTDIQSKWITKVVENYPLYSEGWLLTGKGEMLKSDKSSKNLIPLYDDVATIGGTNVVATMNGISQSTEMIDAGDWFPNVTAAIRHYNDSMVEYPSGCILALQQIKEVHSIVWGRNYVIETDEIRVTKRMQTADNNDYIMGYSTNTETYPDGKLIHEPLKILKQDITRIFLVLGRIVKEHSSGPVFTQ